jgi:hypothetical protein
MVASSSRRGRPTTDPTLEGSACCSSARRTPDVQVFDAICINIYEIVQAVAAVMVTVGTAL